MGGCVLTEARGREHWIRNGQWCHAAEIRREKEPLEVATEWPGGQGSWVTYLTPTYEYGYKFRWGRNPDWRNPDWMKLRRVKRREMEVKRRMEGYLWSPKGFLCDKKDLRLSSKITVPIVIEMTKWFPKESGGTGFQTCVFWLKKSLISAAIMDLY